MFLFVLEEPTELIKKKLLQLDAMEIKYVDGNEIWKHKMRKSLCCKQDIYILNQYKAAKDTFEKMKGTKIPSVKELNEEFQQLLAQKRKDYSQYHDAKEKMQLYKVAKYDIDRILNQDIEKEKARLQSRERSQTR